MTAGFVSEAVSERTILMTAMLVEAALALVIIGGSKKHIEKIYNREN